MNALQQTGAVTIGVFTLIFIFREINRYLERRTERKENSERARQFQKEENKPQ